MNSNEEITKSKILRTAGLTEIEIKNLLGEGFGQNKTFGLNIVPNVDGSIDLIIEVKARTERMALTLLNISEKGIRDKIGDNIYGTDMEKLEDVVGYLLYLRVLSLSSAESCTGGLFSSRITDVPGSSNYYRGGIISYQTVVKTSLLNIPAHAIEEFGEVSPQVASAMAQGVAKLLKTDIGVSITGYAGPQVPEVLSQKDVGLVYIGLASNEGIKVEKFIFNGERKAIKEQAACAALNIIRRNLLQ